MNKFRMFLGRISTKTCLKMNYFDSKSSKIAKRWGFHQISMEAGSYTFSSLG